MSLHLIQRRLFKKRFKTKGFALTLESVVVLIFIAILASVLLINARNVANEGRLSRAKADASRLGSAISQYYYEVGEYPTNVVALRNKKGQYGPWVSNQQVIKDPWGQSYIIKSDPNTEKFAVYSPGETGAGSVDLDGNSINGGIGYAGH